MRKYLIIFSQEFSRFTTYRSSIIFGLFSSFVTPVLMLIALSETRPLGSTSAVSLIPYYLLVSQTYAIVKSSVDEKISELAHQGDVNNFLIKPLSFFRYMLFFDLAEKFTRLIYLSPLLLISFFKFQNFTSAGLFLLSLPICYLLSFLLAYLVGLTSFWIDESWAISNVRYVLIQLLGGVILPYSLFPRFLHDITRLTPFPYVVSFPTRLIQGEAKYYEFIIALAWCLFLVFLVKVVEKKAILKYSFVAG